MAVEPNRVQAVFLAAAEITDLAARALYVTNACGEDIPLKARVDALLRAHDQPDSMLDAPLISEANQADAATDAFVSDSVADPYSTVARASGEDDVPLHFLSASTRPDSLGRLGHYEILQVLGKGGFGIVFRAFDETLQRVVAVKVMSPQLATTSPARKRFLREARSSAAVRHENVVQVYEVVEQPLPYLVMEYIPGETLQQRLDRAGPLDVADALRLGRQIAEGLAAAHACDLIHRDIKPSNILIENGTQKAKITDFGLARAADDASLTQSGTIAGTPMYMAPEQALGHKLDQRADLFSFGSVLYQMVSGRPPFRAPSALAVLKRVTEETPRSISEIIPETPNWLCDTIAKLHAKDPNERFQSANEVADVLGQQMAHLRNPALAPIPAIAAPKKSTNKAIKPAPDARQAALKPPAHGLFVTACVHSVATILFAFMLLIIWSREGWVHISTVCLLALMAIGSGFIFFAARRMALADSYGLCVVGSITTMLMPPAWIVGLPVGIWSLVVLRRPEVRALFQHRTATAPGTENSTLFSRWITAAVLFATAVCMFWSRHSLDLMVNNQAMIRTKFGTHPIQLALHQDGKTITTVLENDLRLPPGNYTLEIRAPVGMQVDSSTCYHQSLFGFHTRTQIGKAPQELVVGRGDLLKITAEISEIGPATAPGVDPAQYHQRNIDSARRFLHEARERQFPLHLIIEAEIRLTEAEFNLAEFQQNWSRQDELLGTLAIHYRRLLERARELYNTKEYKLADVQAAEVAVQTVEARQQRLREKLGNPLAAKPSRPAETSSSTIRSSSPSLAVSPVDFNGTWDSSWGPVTFTHSVGSADAPFVVNGTYDFHGPATIQGTVDPKTRTFRGHFKQTSIVEGRLLLTLSGDGASIEGWYDMLPKEPFETSTPKQAWNMSRPHPPIDLNGVWDSNFGEVSFTHHPIKAPLPGHLKGTYYNGAGTIEATVDPITRVCLGAFGDSNKMSGRIELKVSVDNSTIEGTYSNNHDPNTKYPWGMNRKATLTQPPIGKRSDPIQLQPAQKFPQHSEIRSP